MNREQKTKVIARWIAEESPEGVLCDLEQICREIQAGKVVAAPMLRPDVRPGAIVRITAYDDLAVNLGIVREVRRNRAIPEAFIVGVDFGYWHNLETLVVLKQSGVRGSHRMRRVLIDFAASYTPKGLA